ncbi:AraC family transcriptional regulator [Pseudomonas sp. SCB32]|uniref:AraC family transcriptional regulator n=1 Tax=Pseudomonas sp. SCB32 TaxID=2653853 RepID=UPI0012658441|nr:AraC family transcriptional regulator [Pseudomonas sp. SCB32]
MDGSDLTEGLLAQLANALACFDSPEVTAGELEGHSWQDPAAFARMFSDRMDALERLCCARDSAPIFANLAGEMLCHAVINCPDIGAVLERSHRFSIMFVGASRSSRLEREGERVRFSMASRYATRDDAALLSDLIGLHYYLSLLAWLSGQRLALRGVELVYGRPQRSNRLLELFGAPVQFDQPRNALLLDEAMLARPVVRTPAELAAILDCFPYNFIIETLDEHGLPAQVKLLLDHALRQGRRLPSAVTIADILHMSEATLRRQLRAHGTRYMQLRASSLQESAERLMQDGGASIASVAQRLGFSDDRAFRRAFKGWTGLRPSASPARGGATSARSAE